MSKILAGVFLVVATQLLAQKPEEEFLKYAQKYPESNAIMTRESEVIHLSLVNDSIKATADLYEEYFYLGDSPTGYARDRVYSSGFSRASDIEAYSLIPGKRKYERVDVEDFKESFEMQSFVFYDDGKEIKFNYPSLVKGSKSVLKYKQTYQDSRMIGMFFFQSYLPIEKAEYRIVYDSRIDVAVEVFNDPDSLIHITKSQDESGNWVLSCIVKDAPKIKFDKKSPSYQSLVPTAHFRVQSYEVNGKQIRVLQDVSDLHSWYQSFIDKVGEPDESVKEMVRKIISPQDSPFEKMKKIYYWVQSNVRYIAFEDGMRGFVPHPGKYVLEKRYGDCKDMSSIIVDMLRAAGLTAYHTWIGTRDIPYTYEESPTPIVDNHMIATCFIGDQPYFLDATGSYTPIGFPTSMIQGKQCLINLGDSYKLLEVPVIPKEQNVMKDSVLFDISGGTVKGSGQVELTGYAKVFNSYRLIKTNQKGVDDYVNRLLGKGSNKFKTTHYSLSGVNNLDVSTKIDYDFTIQDYYKQIGDKIYFNLMLDQTLMNDLIENREVALENDYLYTNENVACMKIPDGFEVDYLPENQRDENEFFSFAIEYEKQGNLVIARKTFSVNYLELQVDQFDQWNAIIKKYTRACKNALVLKNTAN